MADVILNITVPDAWVTKTMDAFNTVTDTHMTIEARGHSPNPEDEFDGRWDFQIAVKEAGETDKQFGQRVVRELAKAVVNMVDLAEDSKRYRTEMAAIAPPESDVPEDVIE
jgi:hypothetical protein